MHRCKPVASIPLLLSFVLLASCMAKGQHNTSNAPSGMTNPPERIVSLAPATTSIIIALNATDRLVGVDSWSAKTHKIPSTIPQFDLIRPDAETLMALEPDVILLSSLTGEGKPEESLSPLIQRGIKIEIFHTSENLADVFADIQRIADLLGYSSKGQDLVHRLTDEVEAIRASGAAIPEEQRKTVYFEQSPAPALYSFGSGVYLDELLSIAGAHNCLADKTGWLAISAEEILARSPDVILTNTAFIDDPVHEILSRPGWTHIPAVQNHAVYKIDSNASSQPGPDVLVALREIYKAVYPNGTTP